MTMAVPPDYQRVGYGLPVSSIKNWLLLNKAHLNEGDQLAKWFALKGVKIFQHTSKQRKYNWIS